MPYIAKDDRADLDPWGKIPAVDTPGELNYQITRLCALYLYTHGQSYKTINDCLGAMEGAKLEFYRRVASPYEDKKCEQNGDVYYVLDQIQR